MSVYKKNRDPLKQALSWKVDSWRVKGISNWVASNFIVTLQTCSKLIINYEAGHFHKKIMKGTRLKGLIMFPFYEEETELIDFSAHMCFRLLIELSIRCMTIQIVFPKSILTVD